MDQQDFTALENLLNSSMHSTYSYTQNQPQRRDPSLFEQDRSGISTPAREQQAFDLNQSRRLNAEIPNFQNPGSYTQQNYKPQDFGGFPNTTNPSFLGGQTRPSVSQSFLQAQNPTLMGQNTNSYQTLPGFPNNNMQSFNSQSFAGGNMPGVPGVQGGGAGAANPMEFLMNNMHMFQQFQQFCQMMGNNTQSNNPSFAQQASTGNSSYLPQIEQNNSSANKMPMMWNQHSQPRMASITPFTQQLNEKKGDDPLPSKSQLIEVDTKENFDPVIIPKQDRSQQNQLKENAKEPTKSKLFGVESFRGPVQEREALQETTLNWENTPVGGKGGLGGLSEGKQWKNKENMAATTTTKQEETIVKEAAPVQEEQLQRKKNEFDEVKIGGKPHKTFEELLNEQLNMNPDAVKSSNKPNKVEPKKDFLRKGFKGKNTTTSQKLGKGKENNEDSQEQEHEQEQEYGQGWSFRGQNQKEETDNFLEAEEQAFGKTQLIGKFRSNKKTPNPKKDNKRRSYEEEPQQRESLSDEERRSFAFEDLDEFRSPDRGEYDVNKYAMRNSPVTKTELETGNTGNNRKSVREMSPEYQFEEEERVEEEEDRERDDFQERKHEAGGQRKKYFWEMGDEEKPNKVDLGNNNKKQIKEKVEEKVNIFRDPRVEKLETEIEKFKAENERMKRERKKQEEILKDVERRYGEFREKKEFEMKEMDEYKQEEIKKIRKEKKLLKESHQHTNRKENEEILNLRKQFEEVKEELDGRERKAKVNFEKFKKRLDQETQRNLELKQELKNCETMQRKMKATPAQIPTTTRTSTTSREQQNQKIDISQGRERGAQAQAQANNRPLQGGKLPYHQDYEEEESEEEKDEDVIHEEMHEDDSEEEGMRYEDIIKRETSKSNTSHRTSATTTTKSQGQQHQKATTKTVQFVEEVPEAKEFSDQDYRFDSNWYYKNYISGRARGVRVVNEHIFDEGKVRVQRLYEDGSKEDLFTNGVRRQSFPDGYSIVFFANKDIRQSLPDSTVVYYYQESKTTQTKLTNGECVYKFANGQVEFHYTDDSKDIYFADGTRKLVSPSGEEETFFNDGTVQVVDAQKIKTISYANGLKDVVFPDGTKTRSYPDGRVKKFYPDGSVEVS